MPLSRAQAEDFICEFFRDHGIAAPRIRMTRRFRVTLLPRQRLNLPATITRQALADQIAARLCRECCQREAKKQGRKWARYSKWLPCWQTYVRGVIVRHFGKGDGLS
jgi:hypothetical protein